MHRKLKSVSVAAIVSIRGNIFDSSRLISFLIAYCCRGRCRDGWFERLYAA